MARLPWVVAGIALLATLAARTADQDPAAAEIALQRALDQSITLSLQKVELSEAFKDIAATAKIPLQVDPACYELLPYGATTQMAVDFRQSKLRDALEEMLVPLGLQQTVSGRTVIIRPSHSLARIGRRADWEELKLMQELRTGPDIKAPAAGAAFNLTDAIRTALDSRKDLVVSIANDANPAATEQVRKQLPMSVHRALDLYAQLTNQIWFVEAGPLLGGPTGGTIRIMSPKDWIKRQLERPIQLSRTNEPLEVVVADLTHASGIRFVPEPGLYQAVPVVSLRSDNSSVVTTLEALAGATRIAFEIRDDSILLKMDRGTTNAPPRTDNIIGRFTLPVGKDGLSMEMFIRESDLPPELNELRKKYTQQWIDSLQHLVTTPATIPAPPTSQPTTTQP